MKRQHFRNIENTNSMKVL